MGKGKAGEGKFVILVSEKLVGPGELVEGEWRNARARARAHPSLPNLPLLSGPCSGAPFHTHSHAPSLPLPPPHASSPPLPLCPGMKLLEEFGTVDVALGLTPEQLCEKVKTSDALIIRSATQVTDDVFKASAGRLKVVGRAGVGVDNVDLGSATQHGCLVVNAPTANTVAAAEHGIALLASLARNVAQADASMKAGKWDRNTYVGVSMVGKTLAIIGFGKVGSEVGRRAKGLGFVVIAYDPYASEAKAAAVGVRLVPLDEALATADFFSLHMPMTPDTKGLFGTAAFAKMKKGARIVNVARGGVIDDDALAAALDNGTVAGAALDVFVKEPPPADHPLINRPDVIVTPHLGASTHEAQEDVGVEIAEAVIEALQGKLAATAVNAPMMSPEVLAELAPYTTLAQVIRGGGMSESGIWMDRTRASFFSLPLSRFFRGANEDTHFSFIPVPA